MSQEEGQDSEPFVACYPGPIYRSSTDLPPLAPAAEPSTSDTIPTAAKTITLTQNTGPIYICDNVRIVGETIDTPHTNENIPDMSTERVYANKRAFTGNIFGISVTKRSKEEIIKEEGTPSPRKLKINREIIQQHILSYKLLKNPDGSKYLPKHLTQDAMYKNYVSINPNNKCGILVYVEQLKEMRISRQRSRNCTDCLLLDEEQRKLEELNRKRMEHNVIANDALTQYTQDCRAADSNTIENKKYYLMALEDDFFLPEMPSNEDLWHVSRLVGYNLTLAPINLGKSKAPPSYCMMWHEALAAPDESTIVEALVNFFGNNKNITNFVIWADNNNTFKNWTLFTALTTLVNCKEWNAESINIKYMSKCHADDSYISADSVIKSIETNMKRKEIIDFNALTNIVKSSKRNLVVSEVTQFRAWPKDKLKDSKLKDLLPSIVEVKFDRFSRKLLFRNKYRDSFKELDFLDEKFDVSSFMPVVCEPRGVLKEKKDNIISKFVEAMPEASKSFWMNLPENDNSEDLMTIG